MKYRIGELKLKAVLERGEHNLVALLTNGTDHLAFGLPTQWESKLQTATLAVTVSLDEKPPIRLTKQARLSVKDEIQVMKDLDEPLGTHLEMLLLLHDRIHGIEE